MTTPTPTNAVYQYIKAVSMLAYIYGYAPMIQYIQMSNDLTDKAPMNTMYYATGTATPTYTPFPKGNPDTLYATAWLDLTNTPILLTTPDTRDQNHWYTIQLLDMYTNVIKNLPGIDKDKKEKKFYLVGPDSAINANNASVPNDVQLIKTATNIVYLVAKIEVKGIADLTNATSIMNNITILPIEASADVLSVSPLSSTVLTSLDFFTNMMALMKYNPPPSSEKVLIDQFITIGLDPAVTFNPSALSTNVQNALNSAITIAKTQIIPYGYQYANDFITTNYWSAATNLGIYADAYLRRAYFAHNELANNIPVEHYFLKTSKDSTGTVLDATSTNYKIHFDVSELPKINLNWGYWSITLLTSTQELYDNELDRYSVGTNESVLQFNIDDSLDIYIQNVNPGSGLESNWLPSPAGEFSLVLNMYAPTFEQIKTITTPSVIVNV